MFAFEREASEGHGESMGVWNGYTYVDVGVYEGNMKEGLYVCVFMSLMIWIMRMIVWNGMTSSYA